MGTLIKTLLLVICSIVGIKVYQFICLQDYGRVVYNHAPGPCRQVEGIEHGSEDIQVLPNGKAFITSGFGTGKEDPPLQGQILQFDFNHPEVKPKALPVKGDSLDLKTFRPLGLYLWSDKKEGLTVYVVNHPPSGNVVEKFKYDEENGILIHVESFSSPEHFKFVNDLVVVGEDQFYFTNTFHTTNFMLEMMLHVEWGSVGLFDKGTVTIVEDGLFTPNGINKSPDSKRIYVVNTYKHELRIYDRMADNSFIFQQTVGLGSSCDNVDVDTSTGDIWTGCHPIGHQGFAHLEDTDNVAPSQVLRIHLDDGGFYNITEVYADEGHQISASSVAVYHKGAMLVGSVYTKLLYCEVLHR